MASEAEDLLRQTLSLDDESLRILASYLTKDQTEEALVDRWGIMPAEREMIFQVARDEAPAAALTWLLAEEVDPAVRQWLKWGRYWTVWMRTGDERVVDKSRAAGRTVLVAGLVLRLPENMQIRIGGPGTAGGERGVVPADTIETIIHVMELSQGHYARLTCARALERISGERFGWDVERWRRWLAAQSVVEIRT